MRAGRFTRMYTLSTVQGVGGLWRRGGLCGLGASGWLLGVIYRLLKAAAPFCSLYYSTIKTLGTQILKILSGLCLKVEGKMVSMAEDNIDGNVLCYPVLSVPKVKAQYSLVLI